MPSFRKQQFKRLLNVYRLMLQRCYDSSSPSYKSYGGRGIEVCDSWLKDPQVFVDWALLNGYDSLAPKGECTLDRIDVNQGYFPENCRFVNLHVQAVNRRKTVKLKLFGLDKSLSEWAVLFNRTYSDFAYFCEKLNFNLPEIEESLLETNPSSLEDILKPQNPEDFLEIYPKDLTGLQFGELHVLKYLGMYTALSSGKRFQQYLCKCSCGNVKTVLRTALISGSTISCGCVRRSKISSDLKSRHLSRIEERREESNRLIGQTFNKLTVLEVLEDLLESGGMSRPRLLCKCSCGKIISVLKTRLLSGAVKSCGCLQREKASESSFLKRMKERELLIGKVFGDLTVISLADKPEHVKSSENRAYYLCRCSCGEELIVSRSRLLSRYNPKTHCGCKKLKSKQP